MKPIETPETNITLTGPEGGDIEPLPAHVENGCTSTWWEPSDEDRKRLAEGGMIGLVVDTHPTPPVCVVVTAPVCKNCGRRMEWSEHGQIYVCGEPEEEE